MKVVEAIAEILKREGVNYLPSYPTTPVIDAAAAARIRPIICRQERVGVGIADGFSRVKNGKSVGVFAMQNGPGAENAFSGVATAFSDSVPILILPLGYPKSMAGLPRIFNSVRAYGPVTKYVEEIRSADLVGEVMRRAFSQLKTGRPGPVMVEIPSDIAEEDVDESVVDYEPVKASKTAANHRDVDEAAGVLLESKYPVIHAGQGVLYAGATEDLVELAELVQAPVMTTLLGKSAFPENHPLSLGTGSGTVTGPIVHFLRKADLVFGIGCSFAKHVMSTNIPPGKVMVHATNDERDVNKYYATDYPIIGDAKLVIRQFIEAIKDRGGKNVRANDRAVAQDVALVHNAWLNEWMPKLTSDEVPITPYRVIWDLMQTVDPSDAIVTHDSGSPRNQMVPFYRSAGPRSYLGWGKSHGLGAGLGLAIGAKLAAPEKLAVHWMGDAAFGMVGLDFETAVRCDLPIMAIVSNNSSMACEFDHLRVSHELYGTRSFGGNYAELAKAMGGHAERVESPAEIAPAIGRARKATEDGRAALIEVITSEERTNSHYKAF